MARKAKKAALLDEKRMETFSIASYGGLCGTQLLDEKRMETIPSFSGSMYFLLLLDEKRMETLHY